MTSPPHPCHSHASGQVRYKVMMGRPEDWNHKTEGGFFSGGEASWGWQMAGRFTVARWQMSTTSRRRWGGRDLAQFGALAFDVTHSHVNPDQRQRIRQRKTGRQLLSRELCQRL